MPYHFDRIYKRIPRDKDNRIKIEKDEYPVIRARYASGERIRALAREYNVHKRLIEFILFPERRQKNLADREARGGWKQYYSTERNRAYQKTCRHHRREIFGLVQPKGKKNDNNTNLDSGNGYTDISSVFVPR